MNSSTIRPVYLSPHLDDAALSCGGLIYRQARQGARPLVITCLAGVPDYRTLSPFATELHRRWGQPLDPMGLRRCEDAAALQYLGADYQHWDYGDCIYRRAPGGADFLYASEAALFGDVHAQEQGLVVELAGRLKSALQNEDILIYAPLAVGHHVDHQLVLQAALLLRERRFRVQFYEDYPYVADPQKLAQALQAWTRPPTAHVQALSEAEMDARISAIRLYRSQLDSLFSTEDGIPEQVRSYARKVGVGAGYGEQYWEEGTR
jgi:LmbE family N-acetylglucosaminyl deacetylase